MYGGMLYFPLKVNLFEEIAVELVEAKFGLKGTAAVMKLLCKIHKENGYYLKWNAEQCTLFTNKAGKDINEQEMQGIVDILVEKAFFDPKTYKEQGVLTSTETEGMAGSHQTKKKGPHHPALSAGRDGRGQAGQGQDLYAKTGKLHAGYRHFPRKCMQFQTKQRKQSKRKQSKRK